MNSSRFGKYLVIKFDRDHKVLGAEVRTFLLEKSRVTNASGRNERSYHIFYQLLKGSQVEGGHGAACLKGKTPADFAYTSLSGTAFTEVIPDLTAFGEMDMALVTSNILSADERAAVYDTLAALLHLGNVQLDVDEQDVCSVTAATRANLAKAEELLGIGEIGNVLIERVLRTPRTGTEYHIALDKTAAVNQRDAFVKFIYSSLFLLIVTRMNAKLDASAKRTHSRIGLLDVFGFEIFPTNSFEQLCINYANEKLHNFFLMRVFDVEIELYKMQNLPIDVKTLSYPDNAKVIELLEKPPTSIFSILESQCKMAKGSDKGFNQAILKQHAQNPHFAALADPRPQGEERLRRRGLRDPPLRGRRRVPLARLLQQEHGPALRAVRGRDEEIDGALLAADDQRRRDRGEARKGDAMETPAWRAARHARTRRRRSRAPSPKFLLGLKQLMREIATTHPYFIRCIKPTNNLQPMEFHTAMVPRRWRGRARSSASS